MKFSFGHRKIQKVQYTYMLPIPTDWVKNMNICKGDALEIEMASDNSLRISPIPQSDQGFDGTGVPKQRPIKEMSQP